MIDYDTQYYKFIEKYIKSFYVAICFISLHMCALTYFIVFQGKKDKDVLTVLHKIKLRFKKVSQEHI